MPGFLRDTALSFAPAWVRGVHRPRSPLTVLRGAIITGMAQVCLCTWWLLVGYQAFLAQRMQQYGQILTHGNETTQAWFGGVFSVEYILFHPLALFLAYLALEGLIRFVGGLCASEVVPSLPVVLFFAAKARMGRRQQDLPPIPDEVKMLGDGGRFRIASASAKANWNASLTIEIDGACYEIERKEETGTPPRTHIYLLRRAPLGKIRRGYERYDLPATANRRSHQAPSEES